MVQELLTGIREPPRVITSAKGLSLTPPELIGPAAGCGWQRLESSPTLDAVLPGQTCALQLSLPPSVVAHAATLGSRTLLEVRNLLCSQQSWNSVQGKHGIGSQMELNLI